MKAQWLFPALRGVGAFVAAIFLAIFFLASATMTSEIAGGLGFLLIVLALVLHFVVDSRSFVALLALTLVLAGQLLCADWCFTGLELVSAAMVLFLLEVFIFVGFADGFQRLFSTVAGAVLLAVVFHEIGLPVPLDLTLLLCLVPLAWLWTGEAAELLSDEVRQPAVYGLLFAILGLLVPSAFELDLGGPGVTATAGLAAAFGGFALYLLRRHDARGDAVALTLAALAAVALSTYPSPGVVASLGLAGVAFHRGEKALLAVAAVFLAVFLAGFYHDLDLRPLTKSAMITASGLALLASRLYLKRRIREVPR